VSQNVITIKKRKRICLKKMRGMMQNRKVRSKKVKQMKGDKIGS
jgi:hypothetical protein